jgi:hypothetical protein
MKLTRRGWIVVWILALGVVLLIGFTPPGWWMR